MPLMPDAAAAMPCMQPDCPHRHMHACARQALMIPVRLAAPSAADIRSRHDMSAGAATGDAQAAPCTQLQCQAGCWRLRCAGARAAPMHSKAACLADPHHRIHRPAVKQQARATAAAAPLPVASFKGVAGSDAERRTGPATTWVCAASQGRIGSDSGTGQQSKCRVLCVARVAA